MHRTDLTDLSAFVAVANHKSFRAAASQLGVTPSALSHRLRHLEQRIGARLLHRTTRSVSPTDAGRLALYVHPMIAQIVLAPVWRKFLADYPGVTLEIAGSDAYVDIVAKGYDAGIAPREFVALDMTAVRVTPPLKLAIVGSPEYFVRNAKPKVPADLKGHNCIQLRISQTGKLVNWMLSREPIVHLKAESQAITVSGNLLVEGIDLAIRAAIDGVGIALSLETQVEFYIRAGHLVRVLEDWSPSYDGFYLYYPGQRQVPTALRALIDMIKISYHETKRLKRPEVPFLQ